MGDLILFPAGTEFACTAGHRLYRAKTDIYPSTGLGASSVEVIDDRAQKPAMHERIGECHCGKPWFGSGGPLNALPPGA